MGGAGGRRDGGTWEWGGQGWRAGCLQGLWCVEATLAFWGFASVVYVVKVLS